MVRGVVFYLYIFICSVFEVGVYKVSEQTGVCIFV